ncbi:MAG: transaldolase [Planctomycetes bacterium]|nr:transaldolase [Planctomycetota bacterium]
MPSPLESLTASGTKLWLDSVDPDLVRQSLEYGATGATSNPLIITGLIRSGRFDDALHDLIDRGLDDEAVAWQLTDRLVRQAQEAFLPVFEQTHGDDGYVSFELDPLLEDVDCPLSTEERTQRYLQLGREWSAGHRNRMIKVPATPAGLTALEGLSAAGVTLNVTLIFSNRQCEIARNAIWRGARKRDSLDQFKSVYSIFVSRVDVYTKQHVPELSPQMQGQAGIINAKRIYRENAGFWRDRKTPLRQEIIFASTGTKDKSDPPDKYVSALAGADIQTNPPAVNAAIQQQQNMTFSRTVDRMSDQALLDEYDAKIDEERMETTLMAEGLQKFADPQKDLLALIAEKRTTLSVPNV